MSQKRPRSLSPDSSPETFKSSPIEDRSSTFIALYSPTLTAKELQAHNEFKTASHRIAAWRKPSAQQALDRQRVFETGYDDDGERYGGKNLERVLVEMSVEGAVVVARWYGGVMLGPVRFEHIKNCARDAVGQWVRERARSAKRAKVTEDENARERLILTLRERDESIDVLRDLLAEKSGGLSSSGGGKEGKATMRDYSNLSLEKLERLERVRDASIGWILGRIEEAEKGQVGEAEGDGVAAAGTTGREAATVSARLEQHVRTDEG